MGDIVALRQPVPQNTDAEQAVLGSLLIDTHAINRVSNILRPQDFYSTQNTNIFAAMLALAAEQTPTDVVTLCDYMKRNGAEYGGFGYVASLATGVPTSLNVEHYARIVSQKAALRNLIDAGMHIQTLGSDDSLEAERALSEAEAVIAQLRSRLASQKQNEVFFDVVRDTARRLLEPYDVAAAGVPTRLRALDEAIGGLKRGNLIVTAARPGIGKSSLASTIAWNVGVAQRMPVAVFSFEMSVEEIAEKLITLDTDLPHAYVTGHHLKPADERLLTELAETPDDKAWPIHVAGPGQMRNVEAVVAEAWRMHEKHDLRLIIVDYLQLMETARKNENRQQDVSRISRELKTLALTMNVPVLALSQLNRAPEQRSNGEPILSDLRESGSIEQDADVVLFLFHDKSYDIENPKSVENIAVKIAKNRMGPLGMRMLGFRQDHMAFCDVDRHYQGGYEEITF